MFSYITNGYQQPIWNVLPDNWRKKKPSINRKEGFYDKSHLFYRDVTALRFPARINTALRWTDIQTVRELLIWILCGISYSESWWKFPIERIFES